MKKLFSMILVLGLFYFTFNSSYAKDYASWGALSSCNEFNEVLDDKSGEEVVKAEIRGFLSGLNGALILAGKEKSVRIINYNSEDFALDYLKEGCKITKDGVPHVGLINYFKTLPIYKD